MGDIKNDGTIAFHRSDAVIFNNNITGRGSLVKLGGATLTLTGNNSYEGNTNVNAGTLLINGTHTGGGRYDVMPSATLGGSGGITGDVRISVKGTLSPGASIESLDVEGNVNLGPGTLYIEVDGRGTGSIDLLNVSNLFAIGEAMVYFDVLFALDDPAYVFATYGELEGEFAHVANLPAGYRLDYNYLGGGQIALVQDENPVIPEPMALGLIGAALFVVRKRRR